MNTQVFNAAKASYASGDYASALQLLTQCLEDTTQPAGPGEIGLLYHQIGNCLVKLGNHTEAIQAYTQATADNSYGAVGSVNYNLGMSYAALGDYEDAISHFEIAVSDGKYDSPYKAYLAMGNALMKLGKSAEAGIAFRAAALDEHNPNPVRALLNLGVCFMALNRPNDAVVSYESALQFDMDASLKNKLYANLGQAYVASGQMQNACHAFEQALADKTYFLSDSASVDYQRAVAAVAQGTTQIASPRLPATAPAAAVEGTAASAQDTSGLDVMVDSRGASAKGAKHAAASTRATTRDDASRYSRYNENAYGDGAAARARDDASMDAAAAREDEIAADVENAKSRRKRSSRKASQQDVEERFFASSGADEQWSRLSNAAPKKRRIGLKIAITLVVLLIAALGVGIWFYTQGWGYPSQEEVVAELFRDPDAAKDTLIADGINDATATQLVSQVFQDKSVTIDGVNKAMSTSEVYASTTMVEGGKITYRITLIRDMLTWKISNIEIYHSSLQQ